MFCKKSTIDPGNYIGKNLRPAIVLEKYFVKKSTTCDVLENIRDVWYFLNNIYDSSSKIYLKNPSKYLLKQPRAVTVPRKYLKNLPAVINAEKYVKKPRNKFFFKLTAIDPAKYFFLNFKSCDGSCKNFLKCYELW